MNISGWIRSCVVGMLSVATLLLGGSALGAEHLSGQVLGAGSPIAQSTVALWEASASAPVKLAESRTNDQGQFDLRFTRTRGADFILYLVATGGVPKAQKGSGDNPAIVLHAVLGNKPPEKVIISEFTTIASVWTNAQFLDGSKLQGNALGLRIAAGNVSNFVDLASGGWGEAIQGPLNSGQTPTMANFATLADVLAGCVTLIKSDACSSLFAAATSPTGVYPKDTLEAAESIARYPWYQPEKIFGLLNYLYPIPQGKNMRAVPYMPYLNYAPSAWVLPLKFDGGGYRAGGKAMFDSEADLWVGDNWTVGWQGQDALWQGNATEFAPNGRALSPNTTGFTGGGLEGATFGAAVDARDDVWFSSYGSKSLAVFDKNGKPLTPPEGITFNGRLGLMQGIIVTPSGDVWALCISKSQLVHFPKGDINKGRIVCEGDNAEPCKSFKAPFHLGIDQQDRIWVSNSGIDHITRFPASDPSKTENFKTGGFNSSGLAIDSQGNVWVTNRFGSGLLGMAHLVDMGVRLKLYGVTKASDYLTKVMSEQKGGSNGGSVVLLRPDGSQFPGSPFTGGSLPGPWAVAVDGNDNVWVSNFAGASGQIAHLCGVRTENCPPGMKTGDPISPPLGYVGGGLQMQVDIDVDPAGNVWVTNNWQDIDSCVGTPDEGLSTRCGGQGVVVFYGMAKPVAVPLIGPPRQP
jgi:streptogramin lyase